MLIEGMLASVVAPAVVDLLKNGLGAVSRKWVGLSVDDQIKLQTADIDRLKALSSLDTPVGTPSQWVVDLRASSRYVGVIIAILAGVGCLATGFDPEIGAQLIGIPFSFLFGERMYLTLAGKAK